MKIYLYLISDDHTRKVALNEDTPGNVTAACEMAEEKRIEWQQKVCVYSLGSRIPGRGCIYQTKHIKSQNKSAL